MQEAGTVLHHARSGRLIIKASSQVSDGTLLVDEKGHRAGRVMETIGPVASPYLSVQPMTERIEKTMGTNLYVSEETSQKDRFQRNFSSSKSREKKRGLQRSSRDRRAGSYGKERK